MTQPICRFKRLLDRTWGVYGTGDVPIPGDQVNIVKRDGRHVPGVIRSIVWSGEDAWIARLEDAKKVTREPAYADAPAATYQDRWAGYTPESEEE